jgi:hypothetical protein
MRWWGSEPLAISRAPGSTPATRPGRFCKRLDPAGRMLVPHHSRPGRSRRAGGAVSGWSLSRWWGAGGPLTGSAARRREHLRREAASRIAADNLLTGGRELHSSLANISSSGDRWPIVAPSVAPRPDPSAKWRGRTRPRQRPLSGDDPGGDASRPRPAADLGAGAVGGRHRQLIAATRPRLAAGEQVARMYQEPGLAWLERQAEVAEDLVGERNRTTENRPGS